MNILETEEKKELLEKRLNILQSYLAGISKQDNEVWKKEAPDFPLKIILLISLVNNTIAILNKTINKPQINPNIFLQH